MGLPDDYDWGLTPEAELAVKREMTASVSLALVPKEKEIGS